MQTSKVQNNFLQKKQTLYHNEQQTLFILLIFMYFMLISTKLA